MIEQEIAPRSGSVIDRLMRLPADPFAGRYPLLARHAELRDLLAAAEVEAGRDAAEAGADQTARKDPDDRKPFIEIILPDSTGGAGF